MIIHGLPGRSNYFSIAIKSCKILPSVDDLIAKLTEESYAMRSRVNEDIVDKRAMLTKRQKNRPM